MNKSSSEFDVVKRNAWRTTGAMALAVLAFIVTLEVSEGSPNRELWIVLAMVFWAVAAIVGFISAPRCLRHLHERFFKQK